MNQSILILLSVLFPILVGFYILVVPSYKDRKKLLQIVAVGLIGTGILALFVLTGVQESLTLFTLGENLKIFFRVDELGKIFAAVVVVVWILAGFYSFVYMKHETDEKRYFGFYLIVFGVLLALNFSGNIVTFYLFYEMMTLLSFPLILHNRSEEAIKGGIKYLLYSLCGAYMVLMGIYFLNRYGTTMDFTAGGVLETSLITGQEPMLLVIVFFMILGFGVKAGMFPMHAWLPKAHPVAPAPASAVMSGVIVKAGVLGIIRTVYYLFGAEFIRGTWVQTAWLILTLITIFMGSMLAYLEKEMKKRLAYSTVSQVSYILFGLAVLQPQAMSGALLHVVCHALIKSALFLCAGIIIFQTGKKNVDEMTGIGKEMPITMWCYTFLSLALIGIPPTGGFVSKWHLAQGTLASNLAGFSWLGPVILLVSALLTAGYLLPITIRGFLPGEDYDYASLKKKEPVKMMWIPVAILAGASVLLGVFPNTLMHYFAEIAAAVL